MVLEIDEPLPIDPAASVSDNLVGYVRLLDARIRGAPHFWSAWTRPGLFESGPAGAMPKAHYADPYHSKGSMT